jgi:hypothetical protein
VVSVHFDVIFEPSAVLVWGIAYNIDCRIVTWLMRTTRFMTLRIANRGFT